MTSGLKASAAIAVSSALGLLIGAGGGCGGGGQLTGSGGSTIHPSGSGGLPTTTGVAGDATGGAVGTGGATECVPTPQPAQKVPPTILVVLDTSASMNDAADGSCTGDCGAGSKWATAVAGIESAVGATPTTIAWGLGLLAGTGDACATGGVTVPFQPSGSTTSIADALAARTTAAGGLAAPGDRPTHAAIDAAVTYLRGVPSAQHMVVLLVTDGAPNCQSGAADPLAADTDAAVQSITNALNAGFPTYVAGLAPTDGSPIVALSQMAVAGGVPRSAPPAYDPISSAGDLVAVVNDIVAQLSCTFFSLPSSNLPGGLDARYINVMVGGAYVPDDGSDGWTFDDPAATTLELHGAACDAARAGQPVTITPRCLLF